jgi:hypothetical protein
LKKRRKIALDFEIDKLTNSIQNTISGDSFPTEISLLTKADLKQVTKKNGWAFNWKTELDDNTREVYKLTINNNPNIIQAHHFGGHLMIINTIAANKLIDKYFKSI